MAAQYGINVLEFAQAPEADPSDSDEDTDNEEGETMQLDLEGEEATHE
jgi:hypothetical protein